MWRRAVKRRTHRRAAIVVMAAGADLRVGAMRVPLWKSLRTLTVAATDFCSSDGRVVSGCPLTFADIGGK
jgi:hypothetical protein